MKRQRLFYLLIFITMNMLWCCKSSSKVARTDEPLRSGTQNVDTEVEGEEMESEEILDLSKSLRENLENYFSEYSALELGDETKRENYLKKGLAFFQSTNTPVVIIVNEENDKFVYDKPTNIEQYLDYLKYKRMTPHSIHNIELDEEGKITQLELMVK